MARRTKRRQIRYTPIDSAIIDTRPDQRLQVVAITHDGRELRGPVVVEPQEFALIEAFWRLTVRSAMVDERVWV